MNAQRRTILLVEDELADANLALEAIRSLNEPWDVRHVRDGRAAMAFLLRENEFEDEPFADLVFLDLNLPAWNGLSFLEEISRDHRIRRVPFIVLSTSNRGEDIDRAYALGAMGFIQKPFDYEQFIHSLRITCEYWLRVHQRAL